MAKKDYVVVKAVKLDKKEVGPGEIVSLETGQASGLLGVFIEEATADDKKAAATTQADDAKKTKSKNDGL
jgi:hypothetical protein